ncbi:Nucleotide-binding universal stress protein, UspA family [Natronorubrum sediminis]|uniref:Nucleotide-binding universal stress protein, UspA family n=1 Tax=Natronorubrum sediminis TaxID=640943 RepID=A0A1H6G430_9EURY|nr:universal stress protein [Natronorubrum sediminis]SEH17809.1 Nucleotide-binding universal stress protein, UspA family [Natronorubrum sediminis]
MTIVVAVDESSHASRVVEEANALANAFDDSLHVVYVLSRSDFVDMEETNVSETGDAMDLDRVREIAASVAEDAITDANATAESVGLVGDASSEVTRYADDIGARYIVVGGRKRSPVGKAVFGSVTQSILLNSRQPVVAIRKD